METVQLQLVRGNPGVWTRSCVGKLIDENREMDYICLLETLEHTTESQSVMKVALYTDIILKKYVQAIDPC